MDFLKRASYEGFIAGVIGAGGVALWFFLVVLCSPIWETVFVRITPAPWSAMPALRCSPFLSS